MNQAERLHAMIWTLATCGSRARPSPHEPWRGVFYRKGTRCCISMTIRLSY